MNINNRVYASLIATVLTAGCDNDPGDAPASIQPPTTPLSLQNIETQIFTTNPNDYQRLFTYTSPTDQALTLRLSAVNGPLGGVNSKISTDFRTSSDRTVEIEDLLTKNTFWKDFELKAGESLYLTLSTFGTFRDEFYEYEVELLPSNLNGLARDTDTFEPNDTLNIAAPSDLNIIYSSELEAGSHDQCDTYKYSLSEGLDYTLSTTNLAGSGSSTTGGLQFTITDQNLNPVVSTFDLNQYQVRHEEFSVDTAGNYFLRICSPKGTIYQNSYFRYLASIWEPRNAWSDPFSGTDYEPNNSSALAFEIDVSEKVSSFLAQGAEDYVDSYAVKLYPGNPYQLDVTVVNGPNRNDQARLRLKVFDKKTGHVIVPETPLSIDTSESFLLDVKESLEAVIQLYYQPSLGHEGDIHEYKFNLMVI